MTKTDVVGIISYGGKAHLWTREAKTVCGVAVTDGAEDEMLDETTMCIECYPEGEEDDARMKLTDGQWQIACGNCLDRQRHGLPHDH